MQCNKNGIGTNLKCATLKKEDYIRTSLKTTDYFNSPAKPVLDNPANTISVDSSNFILSEIFFLQLFVQL